VQILINKQKQLDKLKGLTSFARPPCFARRNSEGRTKKTMAIFKAGGTLPPPPALKEFSRFFPFTYLIFGRALFFKMKIKKLS